MAKLIAYRFSVMVMNIYTSSLVIILCCVVSLGMDSRREESLSRRNRKVIQALGRDSAVNSIMMIVRTQLICVITCVEVHG
jgi:hypothetical protein